MVEKHPSKQGSDSKGRFVKGNTMAKQGHGVKLTRLVRPDLSIIYQLPSFFCPHCGHIGNIPTPRDSGSNNISKMHLHFGDCTSPKADNIDVLLDNYKASNYWKRSIHNTTGLDPMAIKNKADLIAFLAGVIEDTAGADKLTINTPLVTVAINQLAKHYRLGEDDKDEADESFGGFHFISDTDTPPPTKEETDE